jgi:LysM repeat protein
MRRTSILILAITGLAAAVTACGSGGGDALDTLPPIKTTSTTTTTTTTPDSRRRFYEVKSGDNIAEIARSFGVPASEIVKLNNLADNGQIIQVGQILEIPTDVVLIEELPTLPASSSTEP